MKLLIFVFALTVFAQESRLSSILAKWINEKSAEAEDQLAGMPRKDWPNMRQHICKPGYGAHAAGARIFKSPSLDACKKTLKGKQLAWHNTGYCIDLIGYDRSDYMNNLEVKKNKNYNIVTSDWTTCDWDCKKGSFGRSEQHVFMVKFPIETKVYTCNGVDYRRLEDRKKVATNLRQNYSNQYKKNPQYYG